MKHTHSITCPQKAASSVGTYVTLAGQIIVILASLFEDKEVFSPTTEAEE